MKTIETALAELTKQLEANSAPESLRRIANELSRLNDLIERFLPRSQRPGSKSRLAEIAEELAEQGRAREGQL